MARTVREFEELHKPRGDKWRLEESGGMAYVAALPDATPSPADFEYYLGILKEKERRRAALNLSVRLSEMAYDDSIDPCALVHDARSYFDQVLSNGAEPGWLDILNGATVTASELQRMEIAPRECLLEPFFKVGDFGILFSQRGVGTTWLAHAIARGVSQATVVGLWKCPKPRRVLMVDGEMPLDLTKERDRQFATTEYSRYSLPSLVGFRAGQAQSKNRAAAWPTAPPQRGVSPFTLNH